MPAGYAYDGRCRLFLASDPLTNPLQPHLGEIEDAVALGGYVLPDGIAYNISNQRVSGADLLSSFDAEAMGRHKASPSITMKSKLLTGETLAWDTCKNRGDIFDLIIFEDVDEDFDPAVADKCFVFTTCEIGEPVLQNTAINTERRFVADFACGGRPYLDAVVVSGS